MTINACPECVVGKHYNCPGDAIDDEADELVTCPCHARGHRPEEKGG